LKVSEQNYDEATEWLARLQASDVSEKDFQKFTLWLMRDSANKPAFYLMLQIWEDLGIVSQLEPFDIVELSLGSLPKFSTRIQSNRLYAPIH